MSPDNDTQTFRFSDPLAAFALLTRLPMPIAPERVAARAAKVAWAWPLVGLVVGALSGLVGWGASVAGVPGPVVAGLIIACSVILTGAMHEDGLADAADGLWGGWDKARRLEIMRDSRIGTYGVVALILSLGLRWSVLGLVIARFPGGELVLVLAGLGALSRAPMAVLMAAMPHARDDGMAVMVGRVGGIQAVLASVIAAVAVVVLIGVVGLQAAGSVVLVTLASAAIAQRKIGGHTGDILGAVQQLAEIAALILLIAHPGL